MPNKNYFSFLELSDGSRWYVKDEDAHKGFVFDENSSATATTAPSVTASLATMDKIYLVGPEVGTKYQWITIENKSTTPSTYSWSQIGTTDINLQASSSQNVRGIVRSYLAGS